ncbi:acyl-CoA dehydrogenase family protein [Streptomyces sp. NPDC058682]|uniref:acyl-CoA dehydrogenase family protein n=1 Tax=Streptomyces sp. NPDC058682 TaxID=3346596 RepID=UPI00365EF645
MPRRFTRLPELPRNAGGKLLKTELRRAARGESAAGAPPRLAAAAKSACSQAFSYVAGEMIQLHGGIGITWEHEAHEFFKRAHGSALLLGAPAAHRARLAADLGFTETG